MAGHTRGLSRFADGHTQIIAAIPAGDAQDRQDAAHFVSEQGPAPIERAAKFSTLPLRDAAPTCGIVRLICAHDRSSTG